MFPKKQFTVDKSAHGVLLLDEKGDPTGPTKGAWVQPAIGAGTDAFGNQRITEPFTLFDSKQIGDNLPLFFDDQQVSGAGTTSEYEATHSSTFIGVADTTAGHRVRQTFQRFNYQSGKSQLAELTGRLNGAMQAGITARMGLFDGDNGLFLEVANQIPSMGIRESTNGFAVDHIVPQELWNVDKLNGKGPENGNPSGIELDMTKGQLWWSDYEWLSIGSVRTGFFINGRRIICHQFDHGNLIESAYMTTPNLPIRYEIINDGSGGAAQLEHMCSTVISEGGVENTGITRYISTNGVQMDANVADTIYAVLGYRLKDTHLDAVVREISMSAISETNDDFEWLLLLNPTIAGAFTYVDETNSVIQVARGATANTVTGGTPLNGGLGKTNANIANLLPNARWIGAAIDNTPDEGVLCVRPLSNNADIQMSLTLRELL